MTEEIPPTPPKKKVKVKLQPLVAQPVKDPASMISSYRKRQQVGPFVVWGLVVLMLVAGVILLVVWLASGNGPKIALFMTETPTPTVTASPTSTATFTVTATVTVTSTQTLAPTPSEPFEYIIVENDNLYDIAIKFELGDNGLQKLYAVNPNIDPTNPSISIGQKILIPNPDYKLATLTPIPLDLPFGTKIEYIIQPGDTIGIIAEQFNSTFDDIVKENKIEDANTIQAGQVIIVRANIVTRKPTITPGASPTPPSPFTATPPGGLTLTPTSTP
jgi:LysM repeat protein